MINSTTWHRDKGKQRNFVWDTNNEGIEVHHTNESPSYIIPWSTFHSVFSYARKLASKNGNIVVAGMSMTDPTTGSVGEWVKVQKLTITGSNLTPRHLSFLGPIYGHMGFIERRLKGNSIQWFFNERKA